MKEGRKKLLIKYVISTIVASLMTGIVIWIRCSQVSSSERFSLFNVIGDGFTTSGMLLMLFAGLMYVSNEGVFLGVSFVARNVFLYFMPMGRKYQETYAQYRERKIGKSKMSGELCILLTGLVFLVIGIIFIVIHYNS